MSNLLLVRNEAKKLGLTNEQIGRFLGRLAQGMVITADVDFTQSVSASYEEEDGSTVNYRSIEPLAIQTLQPYDRVYLCKVTNQYWFFAGNGGIHKSVAQVLRDFKHSEGSLTVTA